MNRLRAVKVGIVALVCSLALFAAGVEAGEPRLEGTNVDEGNWKFDANPYLWVASISADTGVPGSAPSGVDRFATRISGAAMVTAQARYRSVGLFVDFVWLRLDTEAIDPGPAYSAVDLRSDFIHSTTALTYRLPTNEKLQIDLLAGGRLWHVEENLVFHAGTSPGFQTSGSTTWVDPMVGANGRFDLGKRWFLAGNVAVGGFDVSSKIMVDVFGGAGYQFNDWCSATGGYRYLHEEYDRGGYTLKADIQGILLGVNFRF